MFPLLPGNCWNEFMKRWEVFLRGDRRVCYDINQSVKIYFPSNDKELQYSKCCNSWKATRKALGSLKHIMWYKCALGRVYDAFFSSGSERMSVIDHFWKKLKNDFIWPLYLEIWPWRSNAAMANGFVWDLGPWRYFLAWSPTCNKKCRQKLISGCWPVD